MARTLIGCTDFPCIRLETPKFPELSLDLTKLLRQPTHEGFWRLSALISGKMPCQAVAECCLALEFTSKIRVHMMVHHRSNHLPAEAQPTYLTSHT